ncbi:MAG: glycoside hydrolase family 1 protein [bacterium]|nr:glycoside hydrolase family 1 protein [bacterium]
MPKQKILKFPAGFLWGVSTSAYQIEGGNVNDWSQWEKLEARSKKLSAEGKKPADYICGSACDSYNRYEEDLDLVKNLNCGAYRLGIEWSRIEPEQGQWNLKEVEHYRQVLQAAKAGNLKIVLTLWHWTLPLWLTAQGGWANKKAVEYFVRYVELIAGELGSYVDYWVILNEPMVHLANGYLTGKFPPNKKNIFQACKAYNNLTKAHLMGYGIIHKKFRLAKVGLTMLTNYFEPARRWCAGEWLIAKLANHCWNDRFVKKLKNKFDFLGLDYYFHDRIVWYPPFKKNLNASVTGMGWEIFPQGIYKVLKNYKKFNKPLFVMENGLADAKDNKRAKFIIEHLKYVHQAIGEGGDVQGYFYWSLLDNFEWADGFAPKFGLYSVDHKTFKRSARPSAKVYAEICKNNAVEVD